jgi:hypothetical protein
LPLKLPKQKELPESLIVNQKFEPVEQVPKDPEMNVKIPHQLKAL